MMEKIDCSFAINELKQRRLEREEEERHIVFCPDCSAKLYLGTFQKITETINLKVVEHQV